MKTHKLLVAYSATTDTKKVYLYNESYLSMDSAWTGYSGCPILCGNRLTDAAMAPAKFK
jgi:hypothetical protein